MKLVDKKKMQTTDTKLIDGINIQMRYSQVFISGLGKYLSVTQRPGNRPCLMFKGPTLYKSLYLDKIFFRFRKYELNETSFQIF